MKRIFLTSLAAIFFPTFLLASVGVGVGLGKIEMDKPLKPGGIYELPRLPVINTGTEAADFTVGIEYHQDQPQLIPPREWFSFSPKIFRLEPGALEQVRVTLTLPIKAEPGDYFAYVEGRNAKRQGTEGTSIGVAAAAKLYFSVVPASGLQGMLYRIEVLYKKYSPWPQVVFVMLLIIVAFFILRRFVSINLQVGAPKKGKKKQV